MKSEYHNDCFGDGYHAPKLCIGVKGWGGDNMCWTLSVRPASNLLPPQHSGCNCPWAAQPVLGIAGFGVAAPFEVMRFYIPVRPRARVE